MAVRTKLAFDMKKDKTYEVRYANDKIYLMEGKEILDEADTY